MSDPHATRPYMPGNGIVGPDEGRGLLPWSWAEERLIASHHYWVATVWPDGRPHVMPVEGIWHDESIWFASSVRSRKARNLRADPRCVVTTDNPIEPVVVEGVAEVVRDLGAIAELVSRLNDKYSSDITLEFLNPDLNATFRVRPHWVFSLNDKEFTESPTRWEFSDRRTDGQRAETLRTLARATQGPTVRARPALSGRQEGRLTGHHQHHASAKTSVADPARAGSTRTPRFDA